MTVDLAETAPSVTLVETPPSVTVVVAATGDVDLTEGFYGGYGLTLYGKVIFGT